ncbi:hypothetical protein KFK09_015086 [Dendrobium nobile]|uniref:HTH myb-type domain-containing protein n=1 Tax=Dendrobium nobile TaxID=94219 RepID=A0A8T3B4X5_DENNO|nr:hypothetical protein KFK09_015086 [Dendrobium nobile]
MGAPKQKWTSDEESALKAGVVKHGVGKWRTILKDPEFFLKIHNARYMLQPWNGISFERLFFFIK